MSAPEWGPWLGEWNRHLLRRLDPTEATAFADDPVTAEAIASGWLGFPPATEAQVRALEARLGASLPPSYRSFLLTSNGFRQPGVLVPRLLAAEEVDWFRARHQEDTIDAWMTGATADPGPGSPEHDPGAFEHDLPSTLQVSAVELSGTAVYLLNPRVVGADGEWEAFYFAHWVPGAVRYPSFRALMEHELAKWLAPPPPPPPTPWQTLWSVVRGAFRPP